MQSNFKIAFKVNIVHPYFEQGICSCLQIKPGVITESLIKRFGLKIRNKVDGFELYTNSQSLLPAFLAYIQTATGQTYFDFNLHLSDSNFINFTDLPIGWLGQLVYDSNATANTYHDSTMQLGVTLSDQVIPAKIGSLTIRFNDLVKIISNDSYASYQISFNARATQWQYFVINKSALQLNSAAIANKSGIRFGSPQNVVLENGQQAILFSSESTLLPLSKIPQYKFDLVNNPGGANGSGSITNAATKTIFKGLPNPNAERIGVVEVDNKKQISSPMYVYV